MNSFLSLVPALIFSTFFILNPTSAQAEDLELNFKIERYTSVMGEINIRSYIKNVEEYEGFRLAAIEIEAGALNESATTNVFVNGTQQGQTLQLGQVTLKFFILLETDFFMGRGAEQIKLHTPNPAYIKTVNLILTR